MKICKYCGYVLNKDHVCSLTGMVNKRAYETSYGVEPRDGVYMFMPVRMPGSFTILSWVIYCPDGCLYSEDSFNDACVKMDLHASKHEGKVYA